MDRAFRIPHVEVEGMTAEVAIMNQHALVFAADSATTVTHWLKDKAEKRYFKGANKLFQLSC